jgi:NTP pyrophosphatase (non-canonical NTP hydrolase)
MDEAKILQAVFNATGERHQVDLAIEEMGELIVALNHLRRGRCGVDKVAEEIADVKLMLKQLESILDCKEMVYDIKVDKLCRLEDRIQSGENL